jgi:hypothetical protein
MATEQDEAIAKSVISTFDLLEKNGQGRETVKKAICDAAQTESVKNASNVGEDGNRQDSEVVKDDQGQKSKDGEGEEEKVEDPIGGRRRTKRKGRKGNRKSKKGAKQSKNGGRRRSSKNRRKHSHRRKH